MRQLFFAAPFPFFILVGILSAGTPETYTSSRQPSEWEIKDDGIDWNEDETPSWMIEEFATINPLLQKAILSENIPAICRLMPKKHDQNAFFLTRLIILQKLTDNEQDSLTIDHTPGEQSKILAKMAQNNEKHLKLITIYHLLRIEEPTNPTVSEIASFSLNEWKLLPQQTQLKWYKKVCPRKKPLPLLTN